MGSSAQNSSGQNMAVPGTAVRPQHPARLYVAATFSAGATMALFEAAKQLAFPRITVWESHAATVVFSMLVAFAIATWDSRRLGRAQTALRSSVEAEFRMLFNNVNDAIFIVAADGGRILEVNEIACRHLGYSREELIGVPVAQIDANHMTR
jgi:PAS domain-containing protein